MCVLPAQIFLTRISLEGVGDIRRPWHLAVYLQINSNGELYYRWHQEVKPYQRDIVTIIEVSGHDVIWPDLLAAAWQQAGGWCTKVIWLDGHLNKECHIRESTHQMCRTNSPALPACIHVVSIWSYSHLINCNYACTQIHSMWVRIKSLTDYILVFILVQRRVLHVCSMLEGWTFYVAMIQTLNVCSTRRRPHKKGLTKTVPNVCSIWHMWASNGKPKVVVHNTVLSH